MIQLYKWIKGVKFLFIMFLSNACNCSKLLLGEYLESYVADDYRYDII